MFEYQIVLDTSYFYLVYTSKCSTLLYKVQKLYEVKNCYLLASKKLYSTQVT